MNVASEGKIFGRIAWIAVVVKLWVTSNIVLASVYAPFDYTDFLMNAEQMLLGHWLGPYDSVTLIKGPGTELYLAFIKEFGIPLPLAHQAFYALVCFVFVVALRPLVRRGWWLGLIFCVLLFNPTTFDYDAWILNRSQLIPMESMTFVACGIGAVIRARAGARSIAPWLAFFGLFAALVTLTREDTVWVYPSCAIFLAAYLWSVGAFRGRLRSAKVAIAAVPIVVFAAAIETIMTINGAVYGWSTTVETTAPDFVSAYQSLSRIEVPGVDNRVYPAPAAARNMAYAVSPAAAELRPYFDATGNWKHISCSQLSLCDDVSAGWFVWAFREAVQGAGYDKSGSTAREFYLRFSREIDAACDAGRLKCRAKSLSLAPAIRISDAPGVMRFAFEALWHAAAYDQFVLGGLPPLSATGVSVRRDYENVTGAAGIQSFVYQGWLLHKKGAYVYVDSPSTDDFSTFEAFPSPDIRQAFGKSPEFADADLDHARFTITTSCTAGCVIVVENGSAGTARIPLSPATVDDRAAGANYHLDTQFTDPPTFVWTDLKVAGQTQIATFYQQVIRWWFVLVVLAAAVRVVRAVRGKRSTRVMRTYTLVGCTAATMLANCGVLGLVSAVSFYALFPEYETSLFPLLLMCIVMTTAIEGEILIRLLRRRSRPRVPRLSSSSPSL